MNHKLMIGFAVLGFALITGSITHDSSALSPPGGTIRITGRDFQVSVDNRGPSRRGTGDVLLIRQLLFNKGITQKAIGHSDIVCTYTGGPRSRQCNGTYFLPKGKIVVSGSLRFRGFFKLAVVGGTDLYDNVRGSVTGTQLARGPRRELLVFRLIA
jgi:hypothetical protein